MGWVGLGWDNNTIPLFCLCAVAAGLQFTSFTMCDVSLTKKKKCDVSVYVVFFFLLFINSSPSCVCFILGQTRLSFLVNQIY